MPRNKLPLTHKRVGPDRYYWSKKINGAAKYFGPANCSFEEAYEAYQEYVAQSEPPVDGCTLDHLCNEFLLSRQAKMKTGELEKVTYEGYRLCAQKILEVLGRSTSVAELRGDDFDHLRAEFARTNGPVGLASQVNRARVIFNYAERADLIPGRVRYGANFSAPPAKVLRQAKTKRFFDRGDILTLLDKAPPDMHAMILLGVNCGFGNKDVGTVPISAFDLVNGWLDFPRPKTGTHRRCPLWPETVESVQAYLEVRPTPLRRYQKRLFVTRQRGTFEGNYMTIRFRRYLKDCDLYRKGNGFYALRHVFETIGGESKDQIAVDQIMGHERGAVSDNYRQKVSDERLRDVANTVRKWLFGGTNLGYTEK